MTNLLINEPPLQVLPSLAKAIGLNEAIILQQIHYWLDPRMNKNEREGAHWVYNSYKQWLSQFPFWSDKTLKRTIYSLESKKLLFSKEFNKFKGERTKWYTINYKELSKYNSYSTPCGQNDHIHKDKLTIPCGQNDQTIYKETETTTEITNSSLNPSSSPLREKEEGGEEYKNNNLEIKSDSFAENLNQSPTTVLKKEFEKNPNAVAMLKTWDEIVKEGQGTSYLQEKRQEALLYALETYFFGELDQWEEFCRKITSSKFLMGEEEGSNFKSIKIDWVLRPEVTEKILEGSYTLGDREVWPNRLGEKEQEEIDTQEAKAMKLIQDQNLGWENRLKSCFFGKIYNMGEGRELQHLLRKEGFDHPKIQEKFNPWKKEMRVRAERTEKKEHPSSGDLELNLNTPKTLPDMEEEKGLSKGVSIVEKAEEHLREKIKNDTPVLESDFKKVFEIRIMQREEKTPLFEAWKSKGYKWCEEVFRERYDQWKQGLLSFDVDNKKEDISMGETSSKIQDSQREEAKKTSPWQIIKEKELDLIEKITCHKVREKDYKEVLELRIKEGIEGSADYKLFKLYGWKSKAGFDKMLEDYKQRMASKAAKHHSNPGTLALFSVNKYEKAEFEILKQ